MSGARISRFKLRFVGTAFRLRSAPQVISLLRSLRFWLGLSVVADIIQCAPQVVYLLCAFSVAADLDLSTSAAIGVFAVLGYLLPTQWTMHSNFPPSLLKSPLCHSSHFNMDSRSQSSKYSKSSKSSKSSISSQRSASTSVQKRSTPYSECLDYLNWIVLGESQIRTLIFGENSDAYEPTQNTFLFQASNFFLKELNLSSDKKYDIQYYRVSCIFSYFLMSCSPIHSLSRTNQSPLTWLSRPDGLLQQQTSAPHLAQHNYLQWPRGNMSSIWRSPSRIVNPNCLRSSWMQWKVRKPVVSFANDLTKYLAFKATLQCAGSNVSPCVQAKSSSYDVHQSDPTSAIHDGRGPQNHRNQSLPVRIYHPIFAKYEAALWSTAVSKRDLEITRELCFLLSRTDTGWENRRNVAIRQILTKLFGVPFQLVQNDDNTVADGAYMVRIGAVDLPVIILELKRWLGEGGCDPFIQAELIFLRYWAQQSVHRVYVDWWMSTYALFRGSIFAINLIAQHFCSLALAPPWASWELSSLIRLLRNISPQSMSFWNITSSNAPRCILPLGPSVRSESVSGMSLAIGSNWLQECPSTILYK